MNEYKVRFLKLIKNPLLPIASTYPYVLVVCLLLGWIYMKNSGTVFQTTLETSMLEKQVWQELTIQEPKVLTAVTAEMIRSGTPELIEKGKQSFATVCASCHGTEGKGDGVAGGALNPKPRDFSAEDGWKNGRKITDMYRTLQVGLLKTGMPGYDYMPVDERLGIIHYIQTTFMVNPPAATELDFTALDAEFSLTKGVEQPGQIPIASAFILLERNSKVANEKIQSIKGKISSDSKSETGAILFGKIITDLDCATTMLFNNDGWKNSTNDLLAAINSNIINNGFNTKAFQMSDEDFTILFNYLKALYT